MFGENCANSGAESGQLEFAGVVGCEEEKRDARQNITESGSRFQTVHLRHREIENDEVGGELLGFLDGIDAVNRFAANGELGIRVEKRTELAANHFVIIYEQN